MQLAGAIVSLPIWVGFVATVVIVLVSVEGGYQWARHRQGLAAMEKEAPVSAMVGATLGLLAFLLAITFGLAVDAFHARKVALLEEANAIRSSYLLTGTIPESHRAGIRAVLRDYAEERLEWAGAAKTVGGRSGAELIDDLWGRAATVGAQNPGEVDVFLTEVSNLIALRAERVMVRERSHIPGAFWVALYAMAVLSLAAMGYHCGVAGTTRSPVTAAVAITFSIVIIVIMDIDRPGEGLINVSQQTMIDLRDSLTGLQP